MSTATATKTQNQDKVILFRGAETPQFGVSVSNPNASDPFSNVKRFNFFYGINRISGSDWELLESHKPFMDTLKRLENQGDLVFLEFSKGEDHDDVSTVKNLEKATTLAKYEFNPSRLRRFIASEKRPEIRKILDANLDFINQSRLENETRSTIVRRFMSSFQKFEAQRQQRQKANQTVIEEW